MTFRSSLARYLRGVLEETSTQNGSDPLTSSPLSTPRTTTRSTRTSPATLEAGALAVVMETMKEMQRESWKETRELVVTILQGRELDPSMIPTEAPQPSRSSFDPPDYDAEGTEDLPGGIQAVFQRQEQEQNDVRLLRTEQEVLARQLDEARAAILDPQGPASELS